MQVRRDRIRFAGAWLSLLGLLSVFVNLSARAAAATLHPARTANATGDPDRFCTYYGENHLAELSAMAEPAEESFAPVTGAWQRPFDLADTSSLEREMARQLLIADNKERAARAVGTVGNPGNPAPLPLHANRQLRTAAIRWANCLASAGATSHPDNPYFSEDDAHAGFRGGMEGEVAFGMMNLGSPPDTGAVDVGYMESTPHRDVILSSAFTEVGIAVACGPDGDCAEVEEFGGPVSIGAHLQHWPQDPIVVAPSGLAASTVLPGPPEVLAAASTKEGTCTVQWAAPAPGGYDQISSYEIVLTPVEVAQSGVTIYRGPLRRRATARHLAAGSYRVAVSALNDLGVGAGQPLQLQGLCNVAPAAA